MDLSDNTKKSNIILCIIIAIHCVLFLILFFFVKKEYHSDEMWLWGIANSKESPHIYMDSDENPIHYGKWESADIFNDYLSIDKDERFDFSIPYNNSEKDMPPFVPILIHFISSLFPGKFSFSYIIPLVLIAIILSDFFLYNIIVCGGMSRHTALLTVILFSFSVGGVDLFIFLRHYSLFVMECLMLLYFHMLIYKNKQLPRNIVIGIIICNYIGVMTHHYYWVFAFLLGVYFVCYYTIKKKYSDLIKYAIAMGIGVGCGFLCYPRLFSSFSKWNDEVFGNGFSFKTQLLLISQLMFHQMIGIEPSRQLLNVIVKVGVVLIYVLIIIIPLIIYAGKHHFWESEKWIKHKSIMSQKLICIKGQLKNNAFLLGICLIEVITAMLIVAKTINMYNMLETSNRYVFYVYPMLAIIIVYFARLLVILIFGDNRVNVFLTVAVMIGLFFAYKNPWFSYLGKESREGMTGKDIHNSNVIVLLDTEWHLTCLTNIIGSDNMIFTVRYDDIDNYLDEVNDIDNNRSVYLISGIGIIDIADEDGIVNYGDNDAQLSDLLEEYGVDNETKYKDFENMILNEWVNNNMKKVNLSSACEYLGKEDTINFTYRVYKLRD